ncbi:MULTISPECIES: hypothetical protein [unclassified Streptomyces]|uniref:hypothetical protein n=1 Tax=unclassified Streptomyces TaxID=2593676 RepID=UPI00039BCCB9|nr:MULTISPECIES: hypothetical protein [unclassified Streptomyces]MYT33463.1 hypothetical protein [Streptomyces sp. SID8354]
MESVQDFEHHEDLYRELHTAPLPHIGTAVPSPSTAPPTAEPDPDPDQVLALIAQEPRRLWKTADVCAALG